MSTPVRSIAGWCATTLLLGVVSLLAACGGGGGSDGGSGGTNPPGATAPSITAQPQAQTVTVGQTATFSVTATGSATLTYQWSKGGVAISGATGATYTTPATTAGDSGSTFTVVVSNSAGSVTSTGAALTANAPVAITAQPQAQSVVVGQTATFSVTATGTATLTYQWSKGGVAISGATGSTYTTPATTAGDSGSVFAVVVTNLLGSVTSNNATLTASTPVAITLQPQSQAVETDDSTTFTVTATGSAPLTYQWQKDGSSISGATGASYNIPAVALNQAGAYTVVVNNPAGSVTSSVATLSVTANPEGLYAGVVSPTAGGPQLPLFVIVLRDGSAAAFVTKSTVAGEPDAHIGYALNGVNVTRGASNFTSNITAYTQGGYTFAGGATSITGTLNGTFIPGTAIQGSIVNAEIGGSFSVNLLSNEYERSASAALIAGTYTHKYPVQLAPGVDTVVTASVTYNTDGTSVSPADTVGCTGTGTFTVPNGARNAYTVTNVVGSCTPPTNGTYVGLMALFPAGTGQAFNGGVNFTTDTIVSISDNATNAYLVISHK